MKMEAADLDWIRKKLPRRDPWAHKGNFGKLLLLCGSRGFTGAAALAARGALRMGAGLVFLGVPESIYAIEAVKLNEPVVFPLPDQGGTLSEAAVPAIRERMKTMDAVLIGPGLGQSAGTLEAVKAVLQEFQGPVVLDADGINLLAAHKNILRGRTGPLILTPHDGEFARLSGHPVGLNRSAEAMALARELNAIVLMKGHRTMITDGVTCYENRTGNPGMAVGGSGDLLAGMLVGLLGQGLAPIDSAVCAAWLHGAAGDLCAETMGEYAMLPSDMLEALPRLLKQGVGV